uniref:Fibronectin type-III domain-containing protein n=1 Tax=Pseudonaja textilis TaxID=8673 RepID=A0A670ZLD4_PSETE
MESLGAIPVQPKLGEFSVLDATSDSVRLHWTVPIGYFDSFLVQYKDADGQPQALPVERGFKEVTVTNLAPSHRYKFNLYGVFGHKRSSPLSTDATTAESQTHIRDSGEPIPIQPSLGEFSVLDVTNDSVRLHWTVPTGNFDSFLVQYKDADGQPQALPVEGGSNEVTVTNLTPSHRYKFNLYGVSGRKRSGPLSTDATTAQATNSEEAISIQPTLGELSVLDVTSNSVHLYWTVPTGTFDSFLIQYKDADGRPQVLPVDGGLREVTVTNLAPSHRYKFLLYGVSGRNKIRVLSADAFTASTTKKEATPKPSLGELSISEATSNSVLLSWTISTGSFDSFLLQYKDEEGRTQRLTVEGDSREVTVLNLAPSHKYKFNLYGISGEKRIGPLSSEATTAEPEEEDEEKQPTLGELSISETTSNSLLLSWSVPTGSFDSFLIQYEDRALQSLPVDGASREKMVSNLAPSHSYQFDLYGISGAKRLGPISAKGTEESGSPSPSPNPSFGELSVSDVTSNSARLSWNIPVETFDSFQIQYKDAENKPQMVPVDKGTNTIVIYHLVPSHRYKFNLYGISGRRRFGPITATAADNEKPPGVPGDVDQEVPAGIRPRLGVLSVPEITSHSARLTWTVPEGSFDSFSVQYKDAEGRPQVLPLRGDSRDVIVSNLSPSHKYKFNLYGIIGKQRLGPVSAQVFTTAMPTKPRPPSKSNLPSLGEVTVSEVTPDSLLLSWSVQEGSFDSFIIQYKDASGKPQTVPVDGATRSLHLYNLTASQTYEFDLFGVSGYRHLGPLSVHTVTGHSLTASPSETSTKLRERNVEPQLGGLSVSRVTNNSVALFWTVAAGNFDSFLIQYKDSEGKPQVLPLNGTSRDITVTGLAPSHRYKFNLYGLNGRKRLGPISTNAITGTQPLKLGTLSAHNITSESLLLSWTVESGNFDSFIIQYRDDAGKSQALPVDGGLRSLRFHDLVPSHRYKFNLYGLQPNIAPQPKLGKLSASDVSDTTLRLTWRVLTGKFESFSVEYRDAEGNPQGLSVDTNARDVVISNLVPSHRYKFNLYGISQQKRFGPVSTEADLEAKPKLGDLSISEVTNDSVRLSWTISSGKFDSFFIQYKDARGNPQTVPVGVDSWTVFISNLIPSHKYKFSLYGLSEKKQFGPVSIDAVTAESTSAPAPLLDHLVVSEVTSTTLQLSWDVPEGEFDSFLVRWKDSLGRGQTPAQEVKVPGDERSVTLQGLTPSTKYSLTVYGIKDESEVADISTGARTSGLGKGAGRVTPM